LLPLAVSVTLALAACGDGAPADGTNAPFYAGKTVELIIPFDPGGGSDLIGRLIADILSDTIEGNPSVTPVNVPGADGMVGNNLFTTRDADGLTLLQGAVSATFAQIFGNRDAKFDYGDWEPLLAGPQGAVVYARPDAGVDDGTQLLAPPVELVYAAGSAEGSDLSRLAALDLLGVEYRPVFGFAGGGEARLAFQQGQVNLSSDLAIAYLENVVPLVEDEEAVPMFSLGLVEEGELVTDPAFPDIPTFADVYRETHGTDPEGVEFEATKLLVNAALAFNKVLFVHDDAPQEAKDALRAGIEGLLMDSRYTDALEGFMGGYGFVTGDAVVANLAAIQEPEPEVVDWIVNWAGERFDARLGE